MSDTVPTIAVSFMEPIASGCALIGTWPMFSPPSRGEIVILTPRPRGRRGKYRVKEVLHYLPEAAGEDAPPGVTVLVALIIDAGDVDRALSELCAQSDPATWPRPRVHHA